VQTISLSATMIAKKRRNSFGMRRSSDRGMALKLHI
jgi:hypothetical protein